MSIAGTEIQPTARASFWAGVRAALPIVIGAMPFGMIYGVLAIAAGLDPVVAMSMSFIVFAGSAQFIATQLFASGSPALLLIATTFIVNLRHSFYSVTLLSYLTNLPRRWQWLLAYFLTDESFTVSVLHFRQRPDERFREYFMLGTGVALWVSWQVPTALGIWLGGAVPASWQLDFTLPLTFIALIMPLLKERPQLGAALTAGAVGLAGNALPYKLGLVLATFAGIAAGLLLERWGRGGQHA